MSSPFPLSPPGSSPGPLDALAALAGGQGGPPDPFGGSLAGGGSDPLAGLGGQPGGNPEDQPIALLQQMIDLAKQYMDAEPDQQDVATMAKVLSTLQGYLAKDQADRDAALGNGSIARLMRKTP